MTTTTTTQQPRLDYKGAAPEGYKALSSFVGFLHGVPGMPTDKVGGALARHHNN